MDIGLAIFLSVLTCCVTTMTGIVLVICFARKIVRGVFDDLGRHLSSRVKVRVYKNISVDVLPPGKEDENGDQRIHQS